MTGDSYKPKKQPSTRIEKVLWVLAGIAALLLLTATVQLVARTRSQGIVGETVYLVGQTGAIRLHESPAQDSKVIAALVRGSPVTVLGLSQEEGQAWYLVQKGEMTPGWVPAYEVTRETP
jgi:hypothetical protein